MLAAEALSYSCSGDSELPGPWLKRVLCVMSAGQTSDALQSLSVTEDTLDLMAQFDANLTEQGIALSCQAGYECTPLNRLDLGQGGVCLRCSLGQYCPYNTSNPASRVRLLNPL